MGDDAERIAQAAKEKEDREAAAAKAKLALATAPSSSAGAFSLTSLHAQAVGLHSIKGHVPVELALDTGVHRQWRTFFRAALRKYALLDHVDVPAPIDPTPEWSLLDATVVSWLYGSVSLGLLDAVMTPGDDPLAVELWTSINGLFNDHKINRQLHLSTEHGEIKMGELSMTEYLKKIKALADGLADLGAPEEDAKLVIHCLNGLSEQYEHGADLISLMPEITFEKCRSLLALQDMKRKNRHARNSDTALVVDGTNPSKGNGNRRKQKKKTAADATKEGAIVPHQASAAPPAVSQPTWPRPQLPWNGAIQMWPYGRAPGYAPRPAPSPHAFYAQGPYSVPHSSYGYGYGYATPPPAYGYGGYGAAPTPSPAPSSPASSTASWDQSALMPQFQTMGLQAPTEWVMDTGTNSHFAANPGSSNQGRDSQMQ
ncbi:unnamed protein product [Alopecurus aequalis]